MSRMMGTTRKTRMNRGRKRPVAGREEILSAARAIGVRKGWEAVTIRSVAQKLGYTSPLLYEHFRDKQDLLTQLAVEAVAMFQKELTADLPADHSAAATKMAERYWTFMLEHKQLYHGWRTDRQGCSYRVRPIALRCNCWDRAALNGRQRNSSRGPNAGRRALGLTAWHGFLAFGQIRTL